MRKEPTMPRQIIYKVSEINRMTEDEINDLFARFLLRRMIGAGVLGNGGDAA